jgi:short-subunit dehydrogenase
MDAAMALPAPSYGSTVLITGASSGIGADMARQLAERGYNVTLVARRRERLEELADELREAHDIHVDVETCDLGSPAARGRLIKKLQTGEREVVGVCNNAGFGNLGNFLDHDLESEGDVVKLNVEALHQITGAFLPRMVEQGAGAVLNVASTAAFQPLPGFATYAASKAFVNSFSEAVHSELSGTGVSVTSLCPGFTKTEFEQAAGAEDAASKLPGFTWMESDDVARQAVEGMIAGKRTVVPGVLNKAVSTSGRYVPRTVLLPLVKTVSKNS